MEVYVTYLLKKFNEFNIKFAYLFNSYVNILIRKYLIMIKSQINYQLIAHEFLVEPIIIKTSTHASIQVTQSRSGYIQDNYGSASAMFFKAVSHL
jgi:hypothetical protein